jgi:hypothetical protein
LYEQGGIIVEDKKHFEAVRESVILKEAVPWRSGKIPLSIGKTAIKGLKQDCLILNDLKFVAIMSPSFLFAIPDIDLILSSGGETNGWIVIASKAQELGYSQTEKGYCKAKTFFFGRPKPGRTLDFLFRAFETGFSLSDFEGFKRLPKDAIIEITVKKKDYHHPSFIMGKQKEEEDYIPKTEIPARVRRVK